jgi:hypothetical protein
MSNLNAPMIRTDAPKRSHSSSTGPVGTPTGSRRTIPMAAGGTPPPISPNLARSQLQQNMTKSMTIDEMRQIHRNALREAEAKRTELRLVLASRYRELVGSSDEVIKMKERAQELQELVQALPQLMAKLTEETKIEESETAEVVPEDSIVQIRRDLSLLPRVIHRALDKNDVHRATVSLIELFTLIASQTDVYPLANQLSTKQSQKTSTDLDPALEAQMRMIFLQVQTLPDKVERIANHIFAEPADHVHGAMKSAAAISSLDLLRRFSCERERAEALLTVYYDAKAKLLISLLNELNEAVDAEKILSEIVMILQHDIVVHPYQIFVIRDVGHPEIMNTLPLFEKEMVKSKCSKFLAQHVPLIRTKVKSVLVSIAGTTASALGQIRQSLYDKTDGSESIERLKGVCTWDEAVLAIVDHRTVSPDSDTSHRFSLWGVLFSQTFSSLVHSLLTTSFQSVHKQVINTLKASLTNAPPVSMILPHEAYRNTLKIATELNQSLLKVSADAHELLVHAEERLESERRLRQSLYVQTCEIMGRLICELRRMAHHSASEDEESDAVKQLIIGRLCFHLKFHLSSLRTLLSPESSPASINATSGMITLIDLQSAFELADDNEDGMITFEEAIAAVESAFSGTPFQGAEMVRQTLLLSTRTNDTESDSLESSAMPTNITLDELTLLTARGLRHEKSGPSSALGTIQKAIDSIVAQCFGKWAKAMLAPMEKSFESDVRDMILTASSVPDDEWNRLFASSNEASSSDAATCKGVSPYVVGLLLNVTMLLNRNLCPSDSVSPIPTSDFATSLGIDVQNDSSVFTLMDKMRWALLLESSYSLASLFDRVITSELGLDLEKSCVVGLTQLYVDVSFVKHGFVEKNRCGFGPMSEGRVDNMVKCLDSVLQYIVQLLNVSRNSKYMGTLLNLASDKHRRALESSDLFFSSLFGDEKNTGVSAAMEIMGRAEGTDPFLHLPLASSRRFALLPVQADRTLSDIQIRGKYAKEKEEEMERRQTASGNVISGGFGFLSSMLKTKK